MLIFTGFFVAGRQKGDNSHYFSKHFKPFFIIFYMEYEKRACDMCPIWHIGEPVNIEAHYYMATKHKVDLVNLHEALHDVLVKARTLEDDNSNIIVSTDGSRVHYDKDNPRTEVIITFLEN